MVIPDPTAPGRRRGRRPIIAWLGTPVFILLFSAVFVAATVAGAASGRFLIVRPLRTLTQLR